MKIYGSTGIHFIKLRNFKTLIFIDDAHTRQPDTENILNFIKTIHKPKDMLLLELPDKKKCLSYGEKTMSYLDDDMSFSMIYKYYSDSICVDYRRVLPTYYLTKHEVESLGRLKKTGKIKLRHTVTNINLYTYLVLLELGRIEPLDSEDFDYKEDVFIQLINMCNIIHHDIIDNRLINYYTMYLKLITYLFNNNPNIFNSKKQHPEFNEFFNNKIKKRLVMICDQLIKLIKYIKTNNPNYEDMAYSKDPNVVHLKDSIALFRFSDPIMDYISVCKIINTPMFSRMIMVCGNSHTYEIINTLKLLGYIKKIQNFTDVEYESFNLPEPTVPIGQKYSNDITHNASDSSLIPYIHIYKE